MDLQRDLGTLNRLPFEIRSMVWQHFLPEVNILREGRSLRCRGMYKCANPGDRNRSCAPLLRVNSFLHQEISNQLHRALPICFNPDDHQPCYYPEDQQPRTVRMPVGIFIPTAGICKATDPRNIVFSKFQALDLWIQMPHTLPWDSSSGRYPFDELVASIVNFTQVIQSQQLSSQQRSTPWRPKINVVVDWDRSRAHHPFAPLLEEVIIFLEPLRAIYNISTEDVQIESRVDSWLDKGQFYLPELFRRIKECMRRPEVHLEEDRSGFIQRFQKDRLAWRQRNGQDMNGPVGSRAQTEGIVEGTCQHPPDTCTMTSL
ncbi:MAG: hypothetical protein Q9184_005686 [Pyrenodesmia sp. 2 TL-2023]